MLCRAHMVGAAHRTAVTGSIGALKLFFVFFIILFTAFLTARQLFKSRWFFSSVITVTLTVCAKFILLIPVFIQYAIFIKTTALTVKILSLPLTVSVKAALASEIAVLALTLSLTVFVKAALTVEALTLALSLTVPVKATLTVEALTLALSLTVFVKAALTVKILSLSLTVSVKAALASEITVLALVGTIVHPLCIDRAIRKISVLSYSPVCSRLHRITRSPFRLFGFSCRIKILAYSSFIIRHIAIFIFPIVAGYLILNSCRIPVIRPVF